jgi:hypothetical protein
MRDELGDVADRLARIVAPDALVRMGHAAGSASRDASLDVAADHLGSDRAMSGLRGRATLRAGYDLPAAPVGRVQLNLRPAGAWALADAGRRTVKKIKPRRRKALSTPRGPRANATPGPSRGLRTITHSVARSRDRALPAVHAQLGREIRGALRQ